MPRGSKAGIISEGIPEGIPKKNSGRIPEGISRATQEGVFEEIPRELPKAIPG